MGNTRSHGIGFRDAPVHPHACGEYECLNENYSLTDGSSPRMWGILLPQLCFALQSRFIPTHVGNTPTNLKTELVMTVHPHACGEYGCPRIPRYSRFGSSPRMWGIHINHLTWGEAFRFIPTHVGNTNGQQVMGGQRTVHPHACGEYYMDKSGGNQSRGSSPRMWGIQRARKIGHGAARFIPTHVGNTRTPAHNILLLTVHPHACGEYSSIRCKR